MDSFRVNSAGDRVHFNIYLPQDSVVVTSIHFISVLGSSNSTALQTRFWSPSHAGMVSLRWPERGDIFLQTTVDLPKNYEESFSPLGLVSPGGAIGQSGAFSANGSKINPWEVEIPGSLRQIQGYYKDQLIELTGTGEAYQVHYFVHYQSKP